MPEPRADTVGLRTRRRLAFELGVLLGGPAVEIACMVWAPGVASWVAVLVAPAMIYVALSKP